MKNKKGFTLIELLAVIVILAIIALIATPIVMNVIENARKGAAERSAENYVRAAETALMAEKLKGPVSNGIYTVTATGDLCYGIEQSCTTPIEVEVNGDAPKVGSTVAVENNKVVQALSTESSQRTTVSVGDYTVEYNEEGKLEVKKDGIDVIESVIIYRNSSDEISIGQEINPSNYSTDHSSFSIYLKHKVENNIVTESYACGKLNGEPVCLRGGGVEYNSENELTMQNLSKNYDCSSSATFYECNIESMNLEMDYVDSTVQIRDGDLIIGCRVDGEGSSSCN